MTEKPRVKLARAALEPLWQLEENPLVSVYIPTHNRADILMERGLKSVLAQTYRNIEVIVVADNCDQGTIGRIMKCCDADSRLKLIDHRGAKSFPHKAENYWFAGRVDPSNVGLAYCSGDWIATNDDDDVWTEDHIERLLRFAQYGNYEFVSAAHTLGASKLMVSPYRLGAVRIGGIQTWLYRSYLKFMKFNPDCWRKSWNRVCDTDLQDRFYKAGVRMGYLDEIVAHIDPRPGETETGLKAYMRDREKTERHFSFG